MAALTLNGTTVTVENAATLDGSEVIVGDAARAFDGTRLRVRYAKKREWKFTTTPMTLADFATLDGIVWLDAALTATGDALDGDSVTVHAEIAGIKTSRFGSTLRAVVQLSLFEV